MSDADGGLQLFAKLSVALDGIGKHLDRSNKIQANWLQRASDIQRTAEVSVDGIIAAGGGVKVLSSTRNQGPPLGEVWELRACRVGGVTSTTTAAGRADLYRSPTDPTNGGMNTPGLANWVDQATTLPLVAYYSQGQVVLRHGDAIWVVISSGTAAQQYLANLTYQIYKDGAYPGVLDI